MISRTVTGVVVIAWWLCASGYGAPATSPVADRYWVEPMKKVHARFTGRNGTFAHFGDSITVSMAYWSPLRWSQKNLDPEARRAWELVNGYMVRECWDKWKGPEYGNTGMMTIRWAHDNIDRWLQKLNPEVALMMFGTNDLGSVKIDEYEARTREVVRRCLDNGTIMILSTIPPKSGRLAQCRQFAEVVLKVGREMNVPVIDYFGECLRRRPDDWDGTLPKFRDTPGDVYQVLTLISRDGVHPSNPKQYMGDFSEEALNNNGFSLRTYLSLMAYADVLRSVLRPEGR